MTYIILVDDHPIITNGISLILNGIPDYEILFTARSLEELYINLEILEEQGKLSQCTERLNRIVTIMDIQLEKSNGLNAVSFLKQKNIITLIYSMFTSPSIINNAIKEGATGYISKSTSNEQFLAALKAVSEGQTYIQQELYASVMTNITVLESLSKKENEVINLLSKGHSKTEIAEKMSVSMRTMENRLSIIYEKFCVSSFNELLEKI